MTKPVRVFKKPGEWTFHRPPGLKNKTMIDGIFEGKVKALYAVGEELSLVGANANRVQEALQMLEFFVVQDIFVSTIAGFADVLLLAAMPSLEKKGPFTRIQRLHEDTRRVLGALLVATKAVGSALGQPDEESQDEM